MPQTERLKPNIQKSVFGSRGNNFTGITDYSNPHITGIVTKRLHSFAGNDNASNELLFYGQHHNSIGSFIRNKIFHLDALDKVVDQTVSATVEGVTYTDAYNEGIKAGLTVDQAKKVAQNAVDNFQKVKESGSSTQEASNSSHKIATDQITSQQDTNNIQTQTQSITSVLQNPIVRWSIVGIGSLIGLVLLVKIIKK